MEPKPKERIVFDEDSYYGDEGEEMAINDLMERDGLTEDEVREDFTDDEIFNHQMEMKDFDYEEEMRALAAFFNGEKSDMSDFVNPYGGNHILVSGSVGRWNGTSTGIAVYKDFDAATDCSPSRFGQGMLSIPFRSGQRFRRLRDSEGLGRKRHALPCRCPP